MCSVTGKSLGQDFRLHIDINQGLPYIDYDALAKKNHLSAMVIGMLLQHLRTIVVKFNFFQELKVRKLKDEIERVRPSI
jgi:hypothetical protein